jgi:radical SAM protein with 4Fe4S-binding SPASM domain
VLFAAWLVIRLFCDLALATSALPFTRGFGVGGVLSQVPRPRVVRSGFIDREVGADFVLQVELPRVRLRRVVCPEAIMRHGEGGIEFALSSTAGSQDLCRDCNGPAPRRPTRRRQSGSILAIAVAMAGRTPREPKCQDSRSADFGATSWTPPPLEPKRPRATPTTHPLCTGAGYFTKPVPASGGKKRSGIRPEGRHNPKRARFMAFLPLDARSRSLPIAPKAAPGRRKLPLADEVSAADRRWRPVYAVWEVTLQCDLACRHCGSRAGRARPDELTTAEALDLVGQMADLGVREVTLIGGEAYLRDDWLEIVRAVRRHGMQCTMTTGGRGVTDDLARAAKAAGLQGAGVSLDGLRATHDHIRALDGSFDSALRALRAFRTAGVATSSNTHINRLNLREVPEVFELLVGEGIRAWLMQFTVAMGRAADEERLLLEPYQVLEAIPMLARLKHRADEAHVKFWAGNNIGYFGPFENVLRGSYPSGHMGSCGAGRTTLGIEANGAIKGCPSLPTSDYVGGNVRDHSLKDIWERSAPLRFTRERTAEELWGHCAQCYYRDHCLGGCTWTTHVLFGRPGNNPFCHHRALELLRQGKRERIVRTHAAGGEPFDYGRFEIVEELWPPGELERARELARTGEGSLDG